jgi:Tol biopolymer transport system component
VQNGLIVYGAEKEGVPIELYTIKSDGTGVTQLTHLRSGEAVNPDWSQDGGATHLRGGRRRMAATMRLR